MFFVNKIYLLLFIPLIAYVVWYIIKGRHQYPSVKFSTIAPYLKEIKSYKYYFVHTPFVLRVLAVAMIILAIARPQTKSEQVEKDIEGIDIMLALDVSSSMQMMDFTPNRIEVAKEVAQEFVRSRNNDNIGLVLFAGESFTQCPLTGDHATLNNLLANIDTEMAWRGVIKDGTAVGMGITTAVTRLKDSRAKSKVLILLTDGSNNDDEILPDEAAEVAKELGVKIYTIAVGKSGRVLGPDGMYYENTIDEETLKRIAETTNGKFFRATDKETLQKIYNEIDKLERTKQKVEEYFVYGEKFQIFVLLAVLFILVELVLSNTILKKVP